MARSGGVSGMAVAVATVGGVLAYAGLRGVSPLQALRDISSGHPEAVIGTPTTLSDPAGSGTTDGTVSGTVSSGARGAVVAGAQSFSGDIYSQAKRRQSGYSDCSAFVDKALRSAGIAPPMDPWATTAMYRLSSQWKTIPASSSQPGDIAVSAVHMVLVTGAGGSSAIGQERTGVNVRTGSVASLMGGAGSYVYRTYSGYASTSTSGSNLVSV